MKIDIWDLDLDIRCGPRPWVQIRKQIIKYLAAVQDNEVHQLDII